MAPRYTKRIKEVLPLSRLILKHFTTIIIIYFVFILPNENGDHSSKYCG
jgi:hypothetical protein